MTSCPTQMGMGASPHPPVMNFVSERVQKYTDFEDAYR
jgi:hypothetical protein